MSDRPENTNPDRTRYSEHPKSSEARELAARVQESLDRGAVSQAKRAFTQGWRETVPALPLRFSVILVRLNRKSIKDVLRLWRKNKGQAPQLKLDWGEETVQVRMARGRKLVLGCLPASDAELLRDMGPKAQKLYRPQLLEVRRTETGEIDYVAVELVRPELRICSSCGKEHSGKHTNCEDCRKRRQRVGAERFEYAPVSFQEVVEQIAAEEAQKQADNSELDF